jgi:hypothetical protein
MRRFAFSPIWYAIRPLARSVITERAEGPDFPGWLAKSRNREWIANFTQRINRRIASRLRSHDPIHAETIGRSYAWMFIKRVISPLAPPGEADRPISSTVRIDRRIPHRSTARFASMIKANRFILLNDESHETETKKQDPRFDDFGTPILTAKSYLLCSRSGW